ncbi:MAG: dockerin type I repeat-containing protein [Candidatus Zixiibacteriota bacterium]|nr:MAG: dockerin type I repeat-containing protein [candidate division Zixibacteria bacterium]
MRKLIFIAGVLLCLPAVAGAQTPCYYIFYGNVDGSTIDVYPDSDIIINLWAATPAIGSGCEDLNGDDIVDSIYFMYTPLASNDSFIVSRDGGCVYYPLDPQCYGFQDTIGNSPPGFTTQVLWRFDAGLNCLLFNTNGDTLHIADFFMRTSNDSSLIGQTVCPFIEGFDPVNGGLVWGIQDGVLPIVPFQIFSCLYFVDYLSGDANGSGFVNGYDVTYLVAYLKGYAPSPDPFLSGDANGDCGVNGSDITYIINYCKGGPAPFLGNCH